MINDAASNTPVMIPFTMHGKSTTVMNRLDSYKAVHAVLLAMPEKRLIRDVYFGDLNSRQTCNVCAVGSVFRSEGISDKLVFESVQSNTQGFWSFHFENREVIDPLFAKYHPDVFTTLQSMNDGSYRHHTPEKRYEAVLKAVEEKIKTALVYG